LLFTSKRWELAPQELDGALSLMGLEPGASVLDLCCGVGRHSLELARRGYRVVGVDRTSTYLEEAALRADAAGLEVEWVHSDMREHLRPEAYDGVINLFTSFGYFEEPSDDRRVVENLYHSLKEGGVVLIDMMGKEIMARIYQPRDWSEEEDGSLVLEERKVSDGWDWMENRWIVVRDGLRTDLRLSHRLYSATELCGLFRQAGFRDARAFGGLDGSPYGLTARRLVVVAHK
jgi:SAM-dependent methyltransferase